jgi:putative MFS transporter
VCLFRCPFWLGGANVPFDLLAELLPASQRGTFLVYIEYFWTFGSVMVAGIAWSMLSQDGWRDLALLTIIPVAITSLLSIIYLPESPRWLLSVGRIKEAEQVLKDAAKVNGTTMPEFRLRNDQEKHSEHVDYLAIVKDKHLRKSTLPLWVVWACFGCTYYGIILFVTRLYSSSDDDDSTSCSFDYSAIFYNSLSEMAAIAINAGLLERLGRVKMQSIFYLVAGFMVFFMGFSMPGGALVAVGILGRMSVMIASVC